MTHHQPYRPLFGPWVLKVPMQPDGPQSVEDRYAEREHLTPSETQEGPLTGRS